LFISGFNNKPSGANRDRSLPELGMTGSCAPYFEDGVNNAQKCVQAVSYFPEEISFQLHILLVV
jgi:hypothetical protein